MKYGRRKGDVRESVSLPSETDLFVEAITGRLFADPDEAARRASKEREQLEWLAQISTEHAAELRKLENAEANARRSRESLVWEAEIYNEAEAELHRVLREEAAAQRARERWKLLYEASILDEAWDPSKRPRLGRAA